MALRLASPGISVREVDLTRGGVDFTLNVVGGLAAPFAKGPCNEITRVNNENELVEIFGKPGVGTTDYHYETWYAASNFLSYGGKLDIVRCVGGDLNTANVAVGLANTTLLLEGLEDYNNNQADDLNWYFTYLTHPIGELNDIWNCSTKTNEFDVLWCKDNALFPYCTAFYIIDVVNFIENTQN